MRKVKKILPMLLIACLCLNFANISPALAASKSSSSTVSSQMPIYLDTSYSFEERAADLVARMTLSEKASQMNACLAPAIPRLGIKQYSWWNEALHGFSAMTTANNSNAGAINNTTSYPINLSMGATWDPSLTYSEASMISDEIRECVPNNTQNLDFYSPTINESRDPRWGRNEESYSEDPYLTSQLGSQFVNGMEGKDMNGQLLDKYNKTITTLKHYVANNSEYNRLNGSSNMSDRILREYYTKAFKNIVQKSNVGSIMSSYNSINGVPSAGSVYLTDTLLRETWGFNGYMTSDCDAIYTMGSGRQNWAPSLLGHVVDKFERIAFAMAAGEDLECNTGYSDGNNYGNTIPAAISKQITTSEGVFNENDVDTSLIRLFTARMELGEFDTDNQAEQKWVKEARARVPQGSWVNSNSNNAVTETTQRLAKAREVADNSLVLLKNDPVQNVDGTSGSKMLPLQVPKTGGYKVAVIGALAGSQFMGGYSAAQGSAGQAKNVTPFNGIKNAIIAVNPSATVTFYSGFTGVSSGAQASSLSTVDQTAITAASSADICIVYVGEDGSTAAEDKDRTSITLPGAQNSLVQQVRKANPKTIVVIESNGCNDVSSFTDPTATSTSTNVNVPALLWSCFNGQEKGDALADVLLGKANASGHLPFIWYQNVSQIPTIGDYTLTPHDTTPGRTYMYYNGPLAYPFGYGLSYTNFTYSNFKIDKTTLDANGSFRVSVDVTNTGSVSGSTVVQLYVNTPDAAAALLRPIKRLEGFKKISLNAGQTQTVTLTVNVPDLAFFNEATNRYEIDNGRYGVQVSTSSADSDIKAQAFISVSGKLTPKVSNVDVKASQQGDDSVNYQKRLIFDKGKKVIPKVTVAMSDETLYGYISNGKSTSLPSGMTVKYTSNRPSVVSVDSSGNITTVNAGVATVTAKVTYNGTTVSEDFIIYVKGNANLSGISINGTPLAGFASTTFTYSVGVDDATQIPQVTATAADPAATATITQATAIPGTATIVAADGGFTQTYTIRFAKKPTSADFTTGTLGSNWTILNEDNTKYTLDSGGLKITSQAGDVSNGSIKNLFLEPAGGDWAAKVPATLSAGPVASNQQAGIVLYGDSSNYMKLDYEYASTTSSRFSFYNVVNGTSSTVGQATSNGLTKPYFLFVKSGTTYSGYYSTDGTNFKSLGSVTADIANPRIGPYACNGASSTAASLDATFGTFKFYNVSDVFPTLSAITVNGSPLNGFASSTGSYSVALPSGTTAIPVVTGTPSAAGMSVTVKDATSIPGITTVTVSTEAASKTYSISFGYGPTNADFTTGTLPSDWTILNPNPATYSLDANGLRLPTQKNDIYGATHTAWENIFTHQAAGDWDVVSKVYFPVAPSVNYQQNAFLAWQDEDNYVKVDLEYGGGYKIQLSYEKGGTSTSVTSNTLSNVKAGSPLTIYYRIKKTGSTYEGLYSLDGTNYTSLGTASIDLANTQIALFATENSSSTAIDTYCQGITVMSAS